MGVKSVRAGSVGEAVSACTIASRVHAESAREAIYVNTTRKGTLVRRVEGKVSACIRGNEISARSVKDPAYAAMIDTRLNVQIVII